MPDAPPESEDRACVLPPGAPLVENLAALWAADPLLAGELEALHPLEPYAVEPSKAGPPTVSVAPAAGGAAILLHSRYQPLAEASQQSKDVDVEGRFAFYVHGFGLGYHVEALFDRVGKEALVFVFEPDLRLLWTALHHRDFSRLIESRRVLFFTRLDKSELFVRLTPHAALLSVGVESLAHAPSLRVAESFHKQVQTWLSEFASFTRTSMNTLVLNSRRTAENIARNIGRYVASEGVGRLENRHKGLPAIIVSAGPSLRKNQHLLKGLAGRAVIIAVQTTLKPLLEMGIEPDYVTSLDYHEICTRFFENLPTTLRTELVAEPKATSLIFDRYPGRVTLLGNEFADSLLRDLKPKAERARLPSGATVAHLAYYLAEHMGSDPIVFVGQDLGFSEGLCYAPGTSYDDVWRPELSRFCSVEMKQWEQIARERFILRRIPDHQGRPMYTEERLFTYLQQFERDFAKSKAKIIDATEGGAAKRGAMAMTLREVIDRYIDGRPAADAPSPLPSPGGRGSEHPGILAHSGTPMPDLALPPGEHPGILTHSGTPMPDLALPPGEHPGILTHSGTPAPYPPLPPGEGRGEGTSDGDVRQCLEKREEEAHCIEQICRDTLPLLEEIRDHVEDQARVNRAISAIDALRARMNDLGATYDLITQLTQSTELERFKADRRLSAATELEGNERQRRQVARDIDNVRAVADAARDFQHLMRHTVDALDCGGRHLGDDAIPVKDTTHREAA